MNINKVIEVLKNTQPTQYASEDRFAYYGTVYESSQNMSGFIMQVSPEIMRPSA